MEYSFTPRERSAFLVKQAIERDSTWYIWPLVLVILLVIALGQLADAFGFTSIAHAQTVSVYHDNAYYCTSIEAGTTVVNATHAQIKSICPNLK